MWGDYCCQHSEFLLKPPAGSNLTLDCAEPHVAAVSTRLMTLPGIKPQEPRGVRANSPPHHTLRSLVSLRRRSCFIHADPAGGAKWFGINLRRQPTRRAPADTTLLLRSPVYPVNVTVSCGGGDDCAARSVCSMAAALKLGVGTQDGSLITFHFFLAFSFK